MNKIERQEMYNEFRNQGWDKLDVAAMMGINYHQQILYEANYKGAKL